MDPIQVIRSSLSERSLDLNLVRSGPAVSLRRPAQAPAPVRMEQDQHVQQTAQRGIPAVSSGINSAFSASAQATFGAKPVKAGSAAIAAPTRPALGEDLAWIALQQRTPTELKGMVQDPAVLSVAEQALLEPGQRQLERELRDWIGLDQPEPATDTEIDLFKLGLGAKLSGFSREQLAIQPSLDVIRIRTPEIDDISLSTGFPINLQGQVHFRAQLQLQKGLNRETHRVAEQALDSRIRFDSQDQEVQFRFGLRQRTGSDQAVSLYAQHTLPFDGRPQDLGLGAYFSQRW
ncbi:MAG: hypothetical protein CVV27_17880 [Candidatus Melainabacteria bacterium HGW-Melainabacteria-1]|nr:MAG: hypothetical protein CVV27_17880 [Candidatus Melainabacteria bacterium HGW-Melainabacteria-1]